MFSILSRMTTLLSDLPLFLLRIPIILLALSFHECAHAWMADKLGDHTAKYMGRMTINPAKHLDPIGAICMLLLGFGWAKPVPVDSRYFQKPKRDMALTAFAGPVSNLLLGFIGVLLYQIFGAILKANKIAVLMGGSIYFYATNSFQNNLIFYSLQFLNLFFTLNVCLAIFNLIPIPPLDGSRILNIFLPDKYYFGIMRYERYIYLGLLLLLFTGVLTTPLSYLMRWVITGMEWLVGLIPFL